MPDMVLGASGWAKPVTQGHRGCFCGGHRQNVVRDAGDVDSTLLDALEVDLQETPVDLVDVTAQDSDSTESFVAADSRSEVLSDDQERDGASVFEGGDLVEVDVAEPALQIGVPNREALGLGLRRLDEIDLVEQFPQTGHHEISARGDVRIVQSRNCPSMKWLTEWQFMTRPSKSVVGNYSCCCLGCCYRGRREVVWCLSPSCRPEVCDRGLDWFVARGVAEEASMISRRKRCRSEDEVVLRAARAEKLAQLVNFQLPGKLWREMQVLQAHCASLLL